MMIESGQKLAILLFKCNAHAKREKVVSYKNRIRIINADAIQAALGQFFASPFLDAMICVCVCASGKE